ncbi:hypothetical protein [Nitrosovibrio sp. Nv6]|uniref:hypothetical protein n=1 Tax=Nitrosovibrio sp. Nv6 TaxID=1855340 RepID=UPI0008CF58C1|nr:hypothetical protein [Nitrosovibrio sp. Nv6]SEO88254.1 hypothetical protein SAMN05216316_1353 [Nitrosovibrio sp. Nv6]
MKTVAIALLAIPLLTACAGSPDYEQISKTLNDGTTHYFIKTKLGPCPTSRDWAARTLAKRANEICKSGYVLIREQAPILLDHLGPRPKDTKLLWQIKCKEVARRES